MVYPFSDHINANFGESRSDGESSRRTITVPQTGRVSRERDVGGGGRGRKRKAVRRPASGAKDSKGKRRSSLFNISLATSFAPVEHSKSLTSSLGRYDGYGPFSWLPIAGSGSTGGRPSCAGPDVRVVLAFLRETTVTGVARVKDKENNRLRLRRKYSLEYSISHSCESNGAVAHRKIRSTSIRRDSSRRSRLLP